MWVIGEAGGCAVEVNITKSGGKCSRQPPKENTFALNKKIVIFRSKLQRENYLQPRGQIYSLSEPSKSGIRFYSGNASIMGAEIILMLHFNNSENSFCLCSVVLLLLNASQINTHRKVTKTIPFYCRPLMDLNILLLLPLGRWKECGDEFLVDEINKRQLAA